MTKEQQAIKILSDSKILMNIQRDTSLSIRVAIETVLSMLKEKDKEIEKKDKIIDLMAEEINETDRGYIDYCQFKMVCDRNCKECIKQYFKEIAERESEE